MINQKYYNDIKKFPTQFKVGFELAKDIKFDKEYDKAIVCGMGGSSFYVALVNDFLREQGVKEMPIFANRSYSIPTSADENTLIISSSYSGNTEEAIACLEDGMKKKLSIVVVTAGGTLKDMAEKNDIQSIQIPIGLQPRLSTGYFIGGVMKILANAHIFALEDLEHKITDAAGSIKVDEEKAKIMAKAIKGKVPIVYATDNNRSIAQMSKIKFNENSKTQAFWNYFPELNHNEMVGYTNMVMKPFFIIFKSKFTHPRNHKRIEVFTKLMRDKELPVEIIDMDGETVFEEILNAYNFIDYVTYFLAEEYEIDPEPVAMVEDFKKMIL